MFTGIVTDLGTVRRVVPEGDTRLEITTTFDASVLPIGASICCSGVCLTVIDRGPDWFAVTCSGETLSCTTIGRWKPGSRVNLERSLRMGDELGGHIVTGHVDGVGEVVSVTGDGDSWRFVFAAPPSLARYIASKGSVALDGVSLTVNDVADNHFHINIIPHTYAVTTFGILAVGDPVNLEIDILARYVARALERE